jgi:xylulokinase
VELLAAEEGGAFGAALLAGVGVGAWPDVEMACAETVHVAEVIAPKNKEAMAEAYGRFRRMYPALREIGS